MDTTAFTEEVDVSNDQIQVAGVIASGIALTAEISYEYIATEPLSAGDPVYLTTSSNKIGKSDAASDTKSLVIGLVHFDVASSGDNATVIGYGPAPGVLSGATAGDFYFLGEGGGITATIPSGTNRIIRMGFAVNPTDFWVSIADLGKRSGGISGVGLDTGVSVDANSNLCWAVDCGGDIGKLADNRPENIYVCSDVTIGGDFESTNSNNGVILKSPAGNRYRITVDDVGVLTTTSI